MKTSGFTIAAAQMRFRPTPEENAAEVCGQIAAAAARGADAILFPECALTGYNIDVRTVSRTELDAALASVAAAAATHRCHVLVGTPTRQRNRWFNSLLVLDRKGREQFRYHKIHLTPRDAQVFTPGNSIAFFTLDGVPCTAILCHERRYPELVRLPVMLGAQVVFHPNAGLDSLAVSRTKRHGRDGIAIRAFENQVFYVFANSVGPQGGGLWSAGDSKIVAPDSSVLAVANNRDPALLVARLNLQEAGRKYAREALLAPKFLRPHWRAMLDACRRELAHQAKERD